MLENGQKTVLTTNQNGTYNPLKYINKIMYEHHEFWVLTFFAGSYLIVL